MIQVLRREEKYPLSIEEAIRYSHKFSQMLMPDVYSQDGSYMVRSLYFDTIEDKDFFDKMKEQNVRRKIRLRIYNPTDTYAKLEMKQKENIFQRKRSLKITREDAENLIAGNYTVLLKYPEEFAAEMYGVMVAECYRPKTIVEYRRNAFVVKENNIRLTLDSDIKATESSFDLFADSLPLNPVFPQDRVIFEVKYDKFLLGYLTDIISMVNTRRITSSKYCMGRSISYGTHI